MQAVAEAARPGEVSEESAGAVREVTPLGSQGQLYCGRLKPGGGYS